MSEPCDLSAVELRRLIGTKALSPVELVESCLRRIEAVNPRLNAIVALDEERAREEARRAEAAVMAGGPLGVLHGLPVGIKDLEETAGLRTTFGSPIYKDHVPAADDRIVAAIRAAGGLVFAKTNTPEFGAGANTTNPVYGATGNPFDPIRTCGGSSGGSAVALATAMLPLATGSDLGGSLRTPAAFCGVVGFRPSPGLVPSERRVHGWFPLTVLGPMARDVADTCLLQSAIAGCDRRDPLAWPLDPAALRAPTPVDLAGLRVGVSTDLGFAVVDRRIAATFEARVTALAPAFKSCAPARLPDMDGATAAFEILRAVAIMGAQREHYEQRRDLLGPNIVANYEQGLGFSAADVAWAQAEQTRIYRGFQALFEEIDLLLTPTAAVPPFPHDQLYVSAIEGRPMRTYFDWLALAWGLTLTTHPVISLPSGLEPTGTPFGLQLCGPRGADGFVLGAALALEAHQARSPELARPRPRLSFEPHASAGSASARAGT